MGRRRKLCPERKESINGLLEHYQPNDAHDVQEMLKDLLGDTLQGMLEAEMDEKLGYAIILDSTKQIMINNLTKEHLRCKSATKVFQYILSIHPVRSCLQPQ